MASVSEHFTKDGKRYYRIRCRRGRGLPEVSTRWYVPERWAESSVQRQLKNEIAAFERSVESGEAMTKDERKAKEAAFLAEQAALLAEQAKIQTFKQYVENVYLPALEVTGAKHTLSSFKGNFKNHIYPRIGEIQMPEISSADLKALLLDKQKKLSADSVVKIYTILRLVFKSAYIDGVVERNPLDRVPRPSAKKEEEIKEIESYTAEETVFIVECLKNEPWQWQCYVKLLIDTGCRRGEACGLKWDDIDFDNNSVFFVRQLCYTPEDGIYEDTLKNRKKRKIFVDPEVMEMLKVLKASKVGQNRKVVNIKEGKNKIGEKFVFTQIESEKKGKIVYSDSPLHPDSPTRYFANFGKRCGIKRFHPHKLRHTQASLAITNGADVVSVSQKLGHSDVNVTLRTYAHASEESQKNASEKFRSALKAVREPKEKTGEE